MKNLVYLITILFLALQTGCEKDTPLVSKEKDTRLVSKAKQIASEFGYDDYNYILEFGVEKFENIKKYKELILDEEAHIYYEKNDDGSRGEPFTGIMPEIEIGLLHYLVNGKGTDTELFRFEGGEIKKMSIRSGDVEHVRCWYENGQMCLEQKNKFIVDQNLPVPLSVQVWKIDGTKCPQTNYKDGTGNIAQYQFWETGQLERISKYKDGRWRGDVE